jgi:hypothetical protein
MYNMLSTRPNVAMAISLTDCFQSNPRLYGGTTIMIVNLDGEDVINYEPISWEIWNIPYTRGYSWSILGEPSICFYSMEDVKRSLS